MAAFFHAIVARLRGFLRPANLDSDFDQELETHLAMAADIKIRSGLSPEEARRVARLELGGVAQLREAARETRGLPWLDGLGLDVKLALRMLRKSWGLTLVGGLAMAITIGLGASVFTIWRTLTGTALPLEDGDRIVAIQRSDAATTGDRTMPLTDFVRWRDTLRSVTTVSAMRRSERTAITPDGSPRLVSVAEMTASGFQVTRVQPLLGRPLLEDDERDGADPVAVIGQEVWAIGFSSDPAVLGRRVQLDGTFYTVVGVMPAPFAFPVAEQIWIPLRTTFSVTAAGAGEVFVFARLADGVTMERSRAELAAVGMLPSDKPTEPAESLPPRVVPYAAGLADGPNAARWQDGLVLLLTALLLVPPCANIAILVYARTITRHEEFAARHALGASRGRIVVQIFVELLVLSAASGLVGFLIARGFALQLSRIVMPGIGRQNLPFWVDFTPSFATVLWVAGLAVIAAAIAGGAPALHATGRWRRAGLNALGSRAATGRLGRTWMALLAIQVAVSMAIFPAGVRVAWTIFQPGILGPRLAVDEFLTAQLSTVGDTSRFAGVEAEVVRRLRASAGVEAIAVSATVQEAGSVIEVDGAASSTEVSANYVDDAFFGVFNARFLAGHAFDGGDFAAGNTAVIVTRSFVKEALGDGNPLGRRVRYRPTNSRPVPDPPGWFEIVGIVDDFIDNHQVAMYHPLAPGTHHPVTLTMRVGSNASLVTRELGTIAGDLDSDLRVSRLRTLGEIYRQQRLIATTFGAVLVTVMVIVLLFTIASNYTLMAFTVAQRWREIGLRSALGAQQRVLVMDIFGRALLPVVAGAVVGGVLALVIDSRVQTREIGAATIPGLVPACVTVMAAVGLLALIGPVRRALRIDPVVTLRDN